MSFVRLTTNTLATVLTMYRTLDFYKEKEDTIATPECKGRAQSFSQSDVYKDMPKIYHLEARLTTAEKAILYQIGAEHDGMALSDNNGAIESKVWLESIDISYEHVRDHTSPWHITLELVVVP